MKRFPNTDLQLILQDRATLYSGSRAVRADLVNRTLLALDELELGLETHIEEDLFLLMDRIASDDESQSGVRQS